jgi:tetratricopeptide (TPR) repeat protein
MRPSLVWLVLAAVVALAYGSAFPPAFQFDDFHLVVDNADVAGWAAWAASMPGIRPLTKASLVLSRVWSEGAAGFVAFSVACHLLGTLLLWSLLRDVLPALVPADTATAAVALLAALLFALHPAQTEAVTYVAGRSIVLSGMFYLAAVSVHLRAADAPRTALASPALFALALAARETAWTLPFALLLLDAARGRRWRETWRSTRWHWLVLGAGVLLVAASPVYRRLLATSLSVRGPLENLFAQVQGIAYLIAYPLVTLRVNFDPDVAAPARPDATWLASATLLATLLGAAALGWRRQRWLAVGVLWFFLHLLPTNGAVARFDFVNDRQLYLALAGPALIVAVAVARLPQRPAGFVASALVLLFGVATAVRNTDYRSEVALWEATARASPAKPRVWNNLGYAWQLAGDDERARRAYVRALGLDPGYPRARVNLDRLDGASARR